MLPIAMLLTISKSHSHSRWNISLTIFRKGLLTPQHRLIPKTQRNCIKPDLLKMLELAL